MDTKVCSKCGWVLDIQDPTCRCPICHTWIEYGICNVCKQQVKFYRQGAKVCKHCYDTVWRKPDASQRSRQHRRDLATEWISRAMQVPKTYPTLTEAQWLEAVLYFNGCALCTSENVDTRKYFIPFDKGGRYCDWNIIPVCEDCAKRPRLDFNYFLYKPAGFNKIISYLEAKLNAAIKQSTDTNSNTAGK